MRKLHISEDLRLPLSVTTERIGILARTGRGKTYTGGVLAEELLDQKQQVVVLTPQPGWHGLRSSKNGKDAGYPITIFGGDHGDLPLDPSMGALVADLIVERRISAIVDLSHFETDADEVRFVEKFADRLFRKNRHPLHLIVDEADNFAPQHPGKNETVMLHRMKRLAKRGRAKGIGMTLISQRSASLNKHVLSQIEILIVLQTTAPQDRDAIEEWVEGKGTPEEQERVMGEIASLKVGEAWVWSPDLLDVLKKVRIREKRTFDSSATPKVGVPKRNPKVLARVDIERLKDHFAAAVEKVKQEDPKLLREELTRTKSQLAEARREVEAKNVALQRKPSSFPQKVTREKIRDVKVPVIRDSQIRALEKTFTWFAAKIDKVEKAVRKPVQGIEELKSVLAKAQTSFERQKAAAPRPRSLPAKIDKINKFEKPVESNGDEKPLVSGEKKMLGVLAQFHPGSRTHSQLGQLSGYSCKGGTYKAYWRHLKKDGYAEELTDGSLVCTQKGLELMGDNVPALPRTKEEKLQMWYGKLIAGERAMLEVLAKHFPEWLTLDELGEESGYRASGGTFKAYHRTLRRNHLADLRGQKTRASATICGNGE